MTTQFDSAEERRRQSRRWGVRNHRSQRSHARAIIEHGTIRSRTSNVDYCRRGKIDDGHRRTCWIRRSKVIPVGLLLIVSRRWLMPDERLITEMILVHSRSIPCCEGVFCWSTVRDLSSKTRAGRFGLWQRVSSRSRTLPKHAEDTPGLMYTLMMFRVFHIFPHFRVRQPVELSSPRRTVSWIFYRLIPLVCYSVQWMMILRRITSMLITFLWVHFLLHVMIDCSARPGIQSSDEVYRYSG